MTQFQRNQKELQKSYASEGHISKKNALGNTEKYTQITPNSI